MRPTPTVYLAGAIRGLAYKDAVDWRERATQMLAPDIEAFSPMRGKNFLEEIVDILNHPIEEHPLLSTTGTINRDLYDIATKDAVLLNLLGATERVSIGSICELAWAFQIRKPLVLIIEPEAERKGTAHDHAWVTGLAPFEVHTLEDGVNTIRAILLSNPGSTPLAFGQ